MGDSALWNVGLILCCLVVGWITVICGASPYFLIISGMAALVGMTLIALDEGVKES